jgi:hypothetical protein
MEPVFWMGHQCFGDSFCISAAANFISKKTGEPVKVSFCESFKNLASYFNNVIFVPEKECQHIDVGIEPNMLLHNGVTRFINPMCKYSNISYAQSEVNIDINIKAYSSQPYISIIASGNMNGTLSPAILARMTERAKIFYPNKEFIFIGHFQNDLNIYSGLIKQYNIKDARTTDKTCKVIIEQIRYSSLVLGVHTGPIFPALAMGLPVWCEHSKRIPDDFCLDFPSNRPLFFR